MKRTSLPLLRREFITLFHPASAIDRENVHKGADRPGWIKLYVSDIAVGRLEAGTFRLVGLPPMTASQETEVSQLARELRDAREQLTTTSEILEVIRNSLNDTQPVFDAIVQSGVRLFPGAAVSIALVENGMVKAAAVAERDPARAELWRKRFPFPLTREYMHSVAILDRKMLDIPDVENAPGRWRWAGRTFWEAVIGPRPSCR